MAMSLGFAPIIFEVINFREVENMVLKALESIKKTWKMLDNLQ